MKLLCLAWFATGIIFGNYLVGFINPPATFCLILGWFFLISDAISKQGHSVPTR